MATCDTVAKRPLHFLSPMVVFKSLKFPPLISYLEHTLTILRNYVYMNFLLLYLKVWLSSGVIRQHKVSCNIGCSASVTQ